MLKMNYSSQWWRNLHDALSTLNPTAATATYTANKTHNVQEKEGELQVNLIPAHVPRWAINYHLVRRSNSPCPSSTTAPATTCTLLKTIWEMRARIPDSGLTSLPDLACASSPSPYSGNRFTLCLRFSFRSRLKAISLILFPDEQLRNCNLFFHWNHSLYLARSLLSN